jgi:hypothetical protein
LRAEWWTWLLIAIGAIFGMLDLSAPLWTALRPLAFVQYPYRLHAILSLALAMLIGIGWQSAIELRRTSAERPETASKPEHAIRRWPLAPRSLALSASLLVILALLVYSSTSGLSLVPQTLPGHKEPLSDAQVNLSGMSEYDYQTALWARLYGGPWLLEYLPAWVTEAREEFFLPSKAPASDVASATAYGVTVIADRPAERSLRVQSPSPFRLSLHTFYFPAWQARVDGIPVPAFPAGPLALASVDVPAGEHIVTLSYEGAWLQHAGELIALVTALALALWLALRSRYRILWSGAALLLLAGALGWRAFAEQASDVPRPVIATLDGRIDLVGFAIQRQEFSPGSIADVTLYWFARQSMHEDFKVFVHLDGLSGGRAGQVDAQPGFNFSPTSRWQPGELVADHYRLTIAPNAAPGTYTLYAGMYRPQPLQNLPIDSPAATPDNRVKLGTITVTGSR